MFLTSERINSDLKLAMDYVENWSQHFIVRFPSFLYLLFICFYFFLFFGRFVLETILFSFKGFFSIDFDREFIAIPIEYEFRAFIVDNKFKAMCQYYHYIFFPTLVGTNFPFFFEKLSTTTSMCYIIYCYDLTLNRE